MAVCCFFGHRDCPNDIKPLIRQNIINLILQKGVDTFYVGNQGNFDYIAYSTLEEVCREFKRIKFYMVLSYLPLDKDICLENKQTLYPDGLERVPKRFAISYRNDWMIKQSDYVICYVNHITGGAYKYVEKAYKKGLVIYNCSKNNDVVYGKSTIDFL